MELFFINKLLTNFSLKIDTSIIPATDCIKILGVSLDSTMTLRIPTVPRKWDFSYGTSSCITYFKLREHLILIK